MALSEIEKLKARYEENPEGRYFAPLADAYRKSGQIDEAIELVKDGLTRHPDYLSAHIVLGRCYLDKKDDASARATLEGVLKLDSENIIALKSLSEIAERMGDKLSARKWLSQLLQIDPTNAEADADLKRLGGPLPEGEEAAVGTDAQVTEAAAALGVEAAEGLEPTVMAAPGPAVTEAKTTPMEALDFIKPPSDEEMEVARHSVSVAVPAIDFIDKAGPADAPPPAPAAPATPPELPLLEIETSAGAAPGAGSHPDWGDAPKDRSMRLSSAMLAGGDETLNGAAEAARPAEDLPLIMPEDVTPPEELRRPSGKQVATVSPEPVEASTGSGAPLLTETMGDLYLKQGFRDQAADVYRRLLAQRPGDRGLEAKLAAVSGPAPALSAAALGEESLGSWLKRVAGSSLTAPAPASAPPPASDPTPMDQAFAEPEPVPVEPPGEPARPASDAFSLDRVFGSESGGMERPASAASAPAPGGASFDEFFGGGPSAGAADTVRPAEAPPGPQAAGGSPEGGDDLSSFSTWLHGLKK